MAIVEQNFSVTPATIVANNIKPGMSYQVILNFSAQNIDKSASLNFYKEGDIIDMVEIDPSLPTERFVATNSFKIPITIKIPEEVHPGTYKGSVLSVLQNHHQNKGITTVGSQIAHDIPIRIEVTNSDFASIFVSSVNSLTGSANLTTTNNINAVVFLKVNAINNGNVVSRLTRVELVVYNQEKNDILAVFNVDELPVLQPFSNNTLTIGLFGKLNPGNYFGVVKVYGPTQNKPIYDQKLFINIQATTTAINFPVSKVSNNRTESGYVFFGLLFIIVSIFIVVFIKYFAINRKKNNISKNTSAPDE